MHTFNKISYTSVVIFFLVILPFTHKAEAALWTPAEISLLRWYDASDTSTITLVDTDNVSQWNAKVGATNLTQTTAGYRPRSGTRTINGLNTVEFDGTDDRMAIGATLTLVSGAPTKREVWSVVNIDDATDEPILANTSSSEFSIKSNQLQLYGGTLGPYGDARSSDIGATPSVLGFIGDTFKRYSINGSLETTTDALGGFSTNRVQVSQVGFRATGSAFDGVIGEIIIPNAISSTDIRLRIEGYLAHKWGLQSKLPSDHIYKNSAPTTSTYTLTFDSSGGSVVAPITAMHGSTVTPPSNPTREGYTFAGWSPSLPTTIPEVNSTHTAQWTINQYTLTFDSDGGSAVSSITGDYNSSFTTPTSPTKTDYSFAGWSPELPATIPSSNGTYTAIWKPGLIFNSDGGSEVETIVDDFGATITPPANPTKDGYTFTGWSPALPSTMPATNTSYTALWNETPTASSRSGSTSVTGRIINLEKIGNTDKANELREQFNIDPKINVDEPKIDQPSTDINETKKTDTTESMSAVQIIKLLISLNIITGDNISKAEQLINTLSSESPTSGTTSRDATNSSDGISTTTFMRDLEYDDEGEDVRQLQQYLINKGYYIQAGATGYFGRQTESALIQFQKDNNISPAIGYFGPLTRETVN